MFEQDDKPMKSTRKQVQSAPTTAPAAIDPSHLSPEISIVDILTYILDASPLALLGVKKGKVFFANGYTERLCGWAPAELLGKPLTRVIPSGLTWDEDTGGTRVITTEIQHRNGNSVTCLVHVSPLPALAPDITILIVTPITESTTPNNFCPHPALEHTHEQEPPIRELTRENELLEERLKTLIASEEAKENLFDALKDLVVLLDRDLRIRWTNKAFRLHFQKNPSDLEGQFCYAALRGRKRTCRGCPTVTSLAEGREVISERRDAQGHTWVYRTNPVRNVTGATVGVVETANDVTAAKRYEEEIRKSEERYRSIIDNLDDGYFENDLRGMLTFINASGAQILDRKVEELIGLDYRTYTPEPEATRIREAYRELYRTGVPIKIFDHEIMRPNGKRRYVDISSSLIRDRHGKPIGFRGTIRDVTERKRREEETQHLRRQLYQSRKLEAIGTLAAGIAHDFNNLLMGIQGYTSLMLFDLDPSHPHYDQLQAVEAQVQSAADLTRQLLGFARGGKYEEKKTNLNELLASTVAMYARTKKELIIHERYSPDLGTVKVDRGQIEQVVLNLLLNAWQAMPAGGDIYISTENYLLEETQREYFNIPPGRYVKFSIRDTGSGMDEETQERIFEPFFTTKEMGRGTGLGLATAYGIVRGHGGVIKVYSEVGLGTTFHIYLPAIAGTPDHEEEITGSHVVKGQGTILLVDDERMIRHVTRDILEWLGYDVFTAANTDEAIAIYREHGHSINLVLLDLIMPGLGGRATFELLKSMNPQIKVILASGCGLNNSAQDLMERGIKGFLPKPFKIDELSRKIHEVLKKE